MSEAKPRRTQAERSAGTRAALLDAAIRMLNEHGYAATTTMLVAKEAGVSRGAMLHQFRTKADLMTFVVEAVYQDELVWYRDRLKPFKDSRELAIAFPKLIWEVLSRPAGVAVLEILQGSRSDAVLAGQLKPIQAEIERNAHERGRRMLGIDRSSLALARLMVWTARGLSVARFIIPNPDEVEESVTLLSQLLEAGIQTGVITPGGSAPENTARAALPAHAPKSGE